MTGDFSEPLLRIAQRLAHVGSWDWDLRSGALRWSEEMYRLHDRDPATFRPTLEAVLALYHPDDRPRIERNIERSQQTGWSEPGDYRVLRPDGGVRVLRVWWEVARDEHGAPVRMIGADQDVTEQVGAARALRESEQRFREIAGSVDAVFWLVTPDHSEILYVSPSYERVWGRSTAELRQNPRLWMETIHPEDRERVLARFAQSPHEHAYEHRIVRPDGEVRWVYVRVRALCDERGSVERIAGVADDVTERKLAEQRSQEAQQRLSRALDEKNALLREIHHRVKNNLQVVSSLLYLQSQAIDDATVAEAMRESRDRVLSMALVHETLYAQRDAGDVDFEPYLDRLLSALRASWAYGRRIRLDRRVRAPAIGIDVALPCGLIVNELVTNAMKHAFPGEREGIVQVELLCEGAGLVLRVSDDGQGMRPDALDAPATLGLRIVRTLSDQLGAELRVSAERGTVVTLWIPDGVGDPAPSSAP